MATPTDRNLMELRSRVKALEYVIASLVATHPDLAAFAANLAECVERITADHLADPQVSDEERERQRQVALEYLGLAHDKLRRPPR